MVNAGYHRGISVCHTGGTPRTITGWTLNCICITPGNMQHNQHLLDTLNYVKIGSTLVNHHGACVCHACDTRDTSTGWTLSCLCNTPGSSPRTNSGRIYPTAWREMVNAAKSSRSCVFVTLARRRDTSTGWVLKLYTIDCPAPGRFQISPIFPFIFGI